MNKSALIIFVRHPVLGKVKTRLAKIIGNEKALVIYNELLNHTFLITKNLLCYKYIFYTDDINENDIWDNNLYLKRIQEGSDLGERMYNAFKELYNEGYQKIVIIGSDCYELNAIIIENAFEILNEKEIVIGPSLDGGYYLLGMSSPLKNLFENIEWSTPHVFNETIKKINHNGYSVCSISPLNDVDVEADLTEEIKIKTGLQAH